MPSPMAASALRRAALATGALAVTLAGHAIASGGARVLPVAPALWLLAIAVAVLPAAGHRGGYAFRALGPARLLGAQIGGAGGDPPDAARRAVGARHRRPPRGRAAPHARAPPPCT